MLACSQLGRIGCLWRHTDTCYQDIARDFVLLRSGGGKRTLPKIAAEEGS